MADKEVSIPADEQGYILLQCEHCGTFFKIAIVDFQDDSVLHVFCPACGLISNNYITEDVRDLAFAMEENLIMDEFYDEMKKLERKFKGGIINFKVKSHVKHVPENPIHSGIDTLEITNFPCCQRTAKIMPLLRLTGCYCPFCGVIDYEIEQHRTK